MIFSKEKCFLAMFRVVIASVALTSSAWADYSFRKIVTTRAGDPRNFGLTNVVGEPAINAGGDIAFWGSASGVEGIYKISPNAITGEYSSPVQVASGSGFTLSGPFNQAAPLINDAGDISYWSGSLVVPPLNPSGCSLPNASIPMEKILADLEKLPVPSQESLGRSISADIFRRANSLEIHEVRGSGGSVAIAGPGSVVCGEPKTIGGVQYKTRDTVVGIIPPHTMTADGSVVFNAQISHELFRFTNNTWEAVGVSGGGALLKASSGTFELKTLLSSAVVLDGVDDEFSVINVGEPIPSPNRVTTYRVLGVNFPGASPSGNVSTLAIVRNTATGQSGTGLFVVEALNQARTFPVVLDAALGGPMNFFNSRVTINDNNVLLYFGQKANGVAGVFKSFFEGASTVINHGIPVALGVPEGPLTGLGLGGTAAVGPHFAMGENRKGAFIYGASIENKFGTFTGPDPISGVIAKFEQDFEGTRIGAVNAGQRALSSTGQTAFSFTLFDGSNGIYVANDCESNGVCMELGQAVFGPDFDGNETIDLVEGKPAVARFVHYDIRSAVNGQANPNYQQKIVGQSFDVTVTFAGESKTLNYVTDETGSGYVEFAQFNAPPAFYSSGVVAIAQNNLGEQITLKSDFEVKRLPNLTVYYVPFDGCKALGTSVQAYPTVPLSQEDMFRTFSTAAMRAMFPLNPDKIQDKAFPHFPEFLFPRFKGTCQSSAWQANRAHRYDRFRDDMGRLKRNAKFLNPFGLTRVVGIVPEEYFAHHVPRDSGTLGWCDASDDRSAACVAADRYYSVPAHEVGHSFGLVHKGVDGPIDEDGDPTFIYSVLNAEGYIFENTTNLPRAGRINLPDMMGDSPAAVDKNLTDWVGLDHYNQMMKRYLAFPIRDTGGLLDQVVNLWGNLVGGNSAMAGAKDFNVGMLGAQVLPGFVEDVLSENSNAIVRLKNVNDQVVDMRLAKITSHIMSVNQHARYDSSQSYSISVPYRTDVSKVSIETSGRVVAEFSILDAVIQKTIDNLAKLALTNGETSRQRLRVIADQISQANAAGDPSGANIILKMVLRPAVEQEIIASYAKTEPADLDLDAVKSSIQGVSERLTISSSLQANPERPIAVISTDKNTYGVSEKSEATVWVSTRPKNPEFEFWGQIELDGVAVKTLPSENGTFKGTSGRLSSGNHIWRVKLYLQKKREAKGLVDSIAKSQQEIFEIEKQILEETDLEIIESMQSQVVKKNRIIDAMNARLGAIRNPAGTVAVRLIDVL